MIGIVLTIGFYVLALFIRKKLKNPLLNPVLVAATFIILTIVLSPISYENYSEGASLIGKSLGPVVVLLAMPLYRHRDAIKRHFVPIILGIFISILSSLCMIVGLGYVFGMNEKMITTLIPKSITTPMAMEVSKMLGGLSDVTVIVVIITGILGATVAPFVMKLGKIKHEISKGIAIGSASHGIGTSKAMEMSDEAGAMSGLAMGLTGIIFVLLTSIFVLVLK